MAYGHLRYSVGVSAAVVLVVACGGSTVSGPNETNKDGGTGSSEAGHVDAGGHHDASKSTDAPILLDSPIVRLEATTDDGPTTKTDSGATGTVKCGMGVTCNAPAQVCCAMAGMMGGGGDGGGAGAGASCVAAGSCNGGLSVACEGTDNCSNGDLCCLGGGMGGASTTCAATCTGMSIQICNMDSDCKTPGDTCRESAELGGVGICRKPPPDGGFHMHDGGFPLHDTGTELDTGTHTTDAAAD